MDELRFLEAIRAAPDDDAPRLVYADWLSERGDPRGEFIVAQCTIARLEAANACGCDEYRRAVVAEALGLKVVEARWAAWFALRGICHCLFFRGLPHTITVYADELLVPGRWASLARVPFNVLGLSGWDTDVALLRDIAMLPGLASLEGVVVRHGQGLEYRLDAKRLALIAPAIERHDKRRVLEALAPPPPFDALCTGIELAFEETDPLFLDQQLPLSVRSFSINSDFHSLDQLIPMLGTARRPFDVLRLLLDEDDSFDELWRAWPFEGLRRLQLHSVVEPTAPNGAAAFASAGIAPTLREFGGTIRLDHTLSTALVEAPLEDLDVTGGGELAALEPLLGKPLRHLSIAGFTDTSGLVDLLLAKAPPTLAYLSVADLDDEDILRFTGPRLAQLTQLTVSSRRSAASFQDVRGLDGIPWLRWYVSRRQPAPDVWPYWFRPYSQ